MAPLMHYFLKEKDINAFKRILQQCLNAQSEKLLIAGDYGTNNFISPTLVRGYSMAAEAMGLNYELYLQSAKTRGEHTDPLLVQKLHMLPKSSIVIMMVSSRIGRLGTIGLSFRNFCKENRHRFLSASSLGYVNDHFVPAFLDSLDVNYNTMQKECLRLKKILDNGREVYVKTRAGTELTFNIETRQARINDGIYTEPGKGGNLPAGEVYIAPVEKTMQGRIVIDGSLKLSNKTIIPKTPVVLDIKNGVIANINKTPESRLLNELLKWAEEKSKKPNLAGLKNIGEFGIGINPKAKVIGSTIIDEKAINTCHFAIGSNAWFGGETYSIIHLDQVIRNPMIKIDNKIIKIWP